jgi:hypothetical protein
MLAVAGALNILGGLTALNEADYLVNQVLYSDLETWGWIFLVWGAVQLLAGILTFGTGLVGPYIGVAVAGIACVLWFFLVFAAPIPALIGIAINASVIYGLSRRVVEIEPSA